jgi:subfamily B ATP-binding cassette protein MsbA
MNLRKDVFAKVLRLDVKYFTEHKVGEIGTRFFEDIEKIRGLMTALFSNIWIEIIVLLFVICAMLTLNVKLTLASVLLVGIQFLIAHFLTVRLKRSTREMMLYRSMLSGFVFEKIQGAVVSKLFSTEKKDAEQFNKHLQHYDRITDKQARYNAISLASVNALSDMTPFIIVMIGSLYVIDGSLTPGSLIAFFAYVDRMRGPVAALVQAFPSITEGSVALQRVFEFLDSPTAIADNEKAAELTRFTDSIRFNHVCFAYDERREVVKDVSFTLKKGKTYAFVGESGGGKSTILRLLTRMYDPNRGEVLIDGLNIKQYSLGSLRRRMGVVMQDSFLYSCSVKENIRLARPDATDDEVFLAAKKAFAHDFIVSLSNGYETEIGERGVKLSGGQKQRIALARVFLMNPDIILLDEATSALDNESEQMVQASILANGRDKTIVMIAHRLSTVLHADTIFVLKNGRIVESGDHESLLRMNGYYKELYAKQKSDGWQGGMKHAINL